MNSIERLMEQLTINGSGAVKTFPELFERAKAMYKEERERDFYAGVHCTGEGWNAEYANGNGPDIEIIFKQDFEEYWQEQSGGGKGEKKINLVEIPQEQLERERNSNYQYFSTDEPEST